MSKCLQWTPYCPWTFYRFSVEQRWLDRQLSIHTIGIAARLFLFCAVSTCRWTRCIQVLSGCCVVFHIGSRLGVHTQLLCHNSADGESPKNPSDHPHLSLFIPQSALDNRICVLSPAGHLCLILTYRKGSPLGLYSWTWEWAKLSSGHAPHVGSWWQRAVAVKTGVTRAHKSLWPGRRYVQLALCGFF